MSNKITIFRLNSDSYIRTYADLFGEMTMNDYPSSNWRTLSDYYEIDDYNSAMEEYIRGVNCETKLNKTFCDDVLTIPECNKMGGTNEAKKRGYRFIALYSFPSDDFFNDYRSESESISYILSVSKKYLKNLKTTKEKVNSVKSSEKTIQKY